MACTTIQLETYGNGMCRVRVASDIESDVCEITECASRTLRDTPRFLAHVPRREGDEYVGGFDVPDTHAVRALREARWRAAELLAARVTRRMYWHPAAPAYKHD
jgi:hypothetical protein